MADQVKLEPHDNCPGGSGKPIRECGCADLLPKLNEVYRGWEGGQRRAALDQVNSLIAKEGMRPCIGTLKARFQFALGDAVGAIETAQQLVEANPDWPAPVALLAEFLAAVDDDRALDVLIDACERYEEEQADVQFLISAILQAGARLAENYDALGCVPWLRIAHEFLVEEGRSEVVAMMLGEYHTRNVSIFANLDLLPLVTPPGEKAPPTLKPFNEAIQASIRGRFHRAIELLQPTVKEHPERIDAWKELVLCQAAIGKSADAVESLREMAHQEGLSDGWKLWLRSVAQWYEAMAVRPPLYRQELEWQVDDATKALELLHGDKRTLILPNIREIARDMTPPPKAAFAVLSHPQLQVESPEEAENIDPAQVPTLTGLALLFGKQTDKPATLKIVVDEEDVESVSAQFESTLSGLLRNRTQTDAKREVPTCLRYGVHWELSVVPAEAMPRLVEKCDQYWLEHVWPDMPHTGLGGKTPRAASQDPDLADDVAAAVFNIEAAMMTLGRPADFDAVRKILNVPVLETIDPWETPVDRLALPEWTRLDMVKLGQQDAMKLFSYGISFGYVGTVRLMGKALLDMLGPEDVKTKARILHELAISDFDLRRSADYLAQAAEMLDEANEDSFPFWYMSLERTLRSGNVSLLEPRMQAAFQAANANPEYLQDLLALLEQFGFSLQPSRRQGQPGAGAPAPPAGGGLWTPESGAPPATTTEKRKDSKLWIPGMD